MKTEPKTEPQTGTRPTSTSASDTSRKGEALEALLTRAAELGAARCLTRLGLENGHAARDIRELRELLEAWRDTRRTVWRTVVKLVTTGLLAALLIGAAIKLKIMGAAQ